MSELAKRLRHLCSPDAERMSDYQRINSMVITGHEAADRIEALEAALNYVADMTYCGADAEWHFKPGYDPQAVLDALAAETEK